MGERCARILFIFSGDPWTSALAAALLRDAAQFPCELLILSRGSVRLKTHPHYLDLDRIESILPQICETKPFLKQSLMAWSAQAEAVYEMIQPDAVVIWNGYVGERGAYLQAAKEKGIPFFFAEKGMLPDSWYLDPAGINADSGPADFKPCDMSAERTHRVKDAVRELDRTGQSGWRQPARKSQNEWRQELKIPDRKKIIFFAGQIDDDTNITFFSDHFKSSVEALTWLAKGVSGENDFVLAKPHPGDPSGETLWPNLLGDKGRALSGIHVLDAIEMASCVVTINSTVAFEAAVRGRPVLLLGKSLLSRQDFVSHYSPAQSSGEQIAACADRYRRNRDSFISHAESFFDYLDSQFYGYLHDPHKNKRILGEILAGIKNPREKKRTLGEIRNRFRLSQGSEAPAKPARWKFWKEKIRRTLKKTLPGADKQNQTVSVERSA